MSGDDDDYNGDEDDVEERGGGQGIAFIHDNCNVEEEVANGGMA